MASRTRFVPIVTDFTRRTQMVVRYRLDDLLQVRDDDARCPCGRVTRTLASIDGRADDVLWFFAAPDDARRDASSRRHEPLFPDTVRHVIARERSGVGDWRIEQRDDGLHLWTADSDDFATIVAALDARIGTLGLATLPWRPMERPVVVAGRKRRRIVCLRKPVAHA